MTYFTYLAVPAVKLYETDSGFDQPARPQTTRAKLGGGWLMESVKPASEFRLPGNVDYFGRVALHAEGQFVSLDARGEFRFLFAGRQSGAVEPLDEVHRGALLGSADARRRIQIEDR